MLEISLKQKSNMPPQAGQTSDQLQQIAQKLRSANNVLVTVSSNPSIDQLSACIGLTLSLNKMNKHGTAVYSGKTPSTIEFLKPEKTLEKDTNSLRDFIISLDKTKADKLRYKVENDVVKIFITPYKTSISEKDFDFSQGDFNVDVVVALGVTKKTDLDRAIVSHGRILHDATVISVNTSSDSQDQVGTMKWVSPDASSLCEMVTDLVADLGDDALDNQIATALLTGVVVETDRFSNEKSSPHTMQVSGKLMEAGASTHLITTKLDQPAKSHQNKDNMGHDGTLEIDHIDQDDADKKVEIPPVAEPDKQPPTTHEDGVSSDIEPKISDVRQPTDEIEDAKDNEEGVSNGPGFVSEPPRMGGRLTANDVPEYQRYDPSTDPLSQTNNSSIIGNPKEPDANTSKDGLNGKTLNDIEESVNSPHLNQPEGGTPPLDNARDAVQNAVESDDNSNRPDPIQALNAQAFETGNGEEEGDDKPSSSPPPPVPPPMMPPS